MEHIRMSDVNSDAEVAKVLNTLNDEIAELRNQNDEYNAVVNKHNKTVDEHNAELIKKGV